MKTKMSLKQAVRQNCKECIYDPHEPGYWVAQIEACTAVDCAFYEHRPLTPATRKRLKQEAYDRMTPEEQKQADMRADEARIRFERGRQAKTPSGMLIR